MRIIKHDQKQGVMTLLMENPDDLWDLHSVIDVGDEARTSTERKIKLGGSDEKTRVIKKRMTLTIRVEKTEYNTGELRLLGPIIDGPDNIPRGNAHSFSITTGTQLTIKKEWAHYQVARLKEATKQRNAVLVVLFDREKALFLNVTGRGIETLLTLKGKVMKKAVDEIVKSTFYQEIISHTQDYLQRLGGAGVVFASPAFFQDYIKKSVPPELAKKAVFTTISDVERTAVKELVKRPELQKLLKDNRTALELGYVEEIMTSLAHDRLAYGDEEVIATINEGNVKTVFLSEKRISDEREAGTFGKTEKLLRLAEQGKGAVHIISSEAHTKIDGLGGLVVIKRW